MVMVWAYARARVAYACAYARAYAMLRRNIDLLQCSDDCACNRHRLGALWRCSALLPIAANRSKVP